MEKAWKKISNKCFYAFAESNRKTDQDALLGFMKFVVEKKLKSKSTRKTTSAQLPYKCNSHDDKNMSIDSSDSSSDSVEDVDEPEEKDDVQEKNDHLEEKNESTKPSNVTKEDPFRPALAKAFNSKFKSQGKRWTAMLHLCTLLKEFKTKREGDMNGNNL